ncbi:MAG: hypothetical protein ACREHD_06760 [Pirellulales bacterium]
MARPKTKSPTKSQAIRGFMRKNKGATVAQIVDGLKSEGVNVTPALVYNVQSDIRKKRAAKRAAKTTTAINGSAETSKAERIRQVAQSMDGRVRPRDVVATLAAEGVKVSSAQVSTVLRSMGMRRRRRGRRPAAATSNGSAKHSTSPTLSLENLLAAKKLANQLGMQAAKQAVDALAKLS